MSCHQTHHRSTPAQPPRFVLRPMVLAVHLAMVGGVVIGAGWADTAHAQQAAPASGSQAGTATSPRHYDIPAGPLNTVLVRFLSESGVLLSGSTELARGKSSPGVKGSFAPGAALAALLAGTGLEAVADARGRYTLRTAPVASASPTTLSAPVAGAATLAEVKVTAQAERADGLPVAYAGGQVARGGRLGLLGNVDVMDTPFNQTSYTAELIENQQAATVMDVLDNEPSIRRGSPASGSAEYFSVRGFDVSSSNISVNGLYGLAPRWGGVPVEFAERVEVLKGPSALLNGMSPGGVVGGAVNVALKRADDRPLTRLTLGLESDSQWKGHLDLGRRFGENNEWGIRLNGSYKNGGTYVDGQDRDGSNVGAIALDYRGNRIRLALDAWRFEEKLRGGSTLFAQVGRYGSGASWLNVIPDAPEGGTNVYPGLSHTMKTEAIALSGELDISSEWTAYAKIARGKSDARGIFTSGVQAVQSNGDATLTLLNYPAYDKSTSGEAGLRGEFRTGSIGHALALSVSRLSRTRGSALSSLWGAATNIYNPVSIGQWPADPESLAKDSVLTLDSLGLADTLSFAEDRVLLTLGVRRQNVKTENFNATGAVTSSYDKGAWTPMVGLVVKPRDNLSLYANYIQGLSEGTTVGQIYQNAGEVFPPYKAKQVEVGAKLETGSFINTLSIFQIEKPSALADNSTTPLPTLRLSGEQRNRGIEWNIFGALTPSVRVLGGVTYIQGRLTKTLNGRLDGNHVAGAAPWAANLGAEWDVAGLPGLTLNGRVIHTGSQYADDDNSLKMPAWTRLDLGARYATRIGGKPVVLHAGIRNALDKKYWEGINYSGSITLAAPRTFALSATVDF